MGRVITNVNLLLAKERITVGPFIHYESSNSDASLGGDVPKQAGAGREVIGVESQRAGEIRRDAGYLASLAPSPRDTI